VRHEDWRHFYFELLRAPTTWEGEDNLKQYFVQLPDQKLQRLKGKTLKQVYSTMDHHDVSVCLAALPTIGWLGTLPVLHCLSFTSLILDRFIDTQHEQHSYAICCCAQEGERKGGCDPPQLAKRRRRGATAQALDEDGNGEGGRAEVG
jgi:hypothetical protein